jgi:hypothetical protein
VATGATLDGCSALKKSILRRGVLLVAGVVEQVWDFGDVRLKPTGRLDSCPPSHIFRAMPSVMRELRRRMSAEKSLPRFEPCLPRVADAPPLGPGWIHEIKHDGFRILAHRQGRTVPLDAQRKRPGQSLFTGCRGCPGAFGQVMRRRR